MDVPRSESSTSAQPPVLPSLALLLGGLLLYVVVWDMLDPPPTWTQCPLPSPPVLAELSTRREDFLPVAVPLVAAYAILLASCAWVWAANRRARQGRKRRPGRLAVGATLILGPAWGLLVGLAYSSDAVGGAIFWSVVLAGLGAIVSAVLAVGVLAGLFRSPTRPRSEDVIDSLSVGLAWSMLLVGVPLLFVGIGVVGKDATMWC